MPTALSPAATATRHVVVAHPNPLDARWAVLDRQTGKIEGDWLPKRRWAQDMADAANA